MNKELTPTQKAEPNDAAEKYATKNWSGHKGIAWNDCYETFKVAATSDIAKTIHQEGMLQTMYKLYDSMLSKTETHSKEEKKGVIHAKNIILNDIVVQLIQLGWNEDKINNMISQSLKTKEK